MKQANKQNKLHEKPQLYISVVMNWVFADKNPPEIDQDDEWNKERKVSKDVLTYSEFGLKFGRFFHGSGNWSLDGVLSGKKLMPKYYAYIILPNAID